MAYGQTKEFKLAESLKEISGLEFLDEHTLVAINDGGNKAELFVLEENGEIRKRVKVLDVKNTDWEDLTSDGTHLYIGDFGNNENKRENLRIYKVKISEVLNQSEVTAEKISFSYKEQKKFPPKKKDLKYDAEGLLFHNDSLWVFTKMNAKPWNGKARVYKLPTTPGKYKVEASDKLFIGDNGWWSDAVTSADAHNGRMYLMTYKKIIVYKLKKGEMVELETIMFDDLTQKESILVKDSKTILIADEKHALFGGGKLYYLNPNNKE